MKNGSVYWLLKIHPVGHKTNLIKQKDQSSLKYFCKNWKQPWYMEIPSRTILLFTTEEKHYSKLSMPYFIKYIPAPKPQPSLDC